MNRKIGFRGKAVGTDKWVYGGISWLDGDSPRKWFINCTIDMPDGTTAIKNIEVNPDTICQFTGLYDKHGKKIYEGDTLRGFKKEQKDVDGFWITDVVFYCLGGFKVFGRSMADCYTTGTNSIREFMWYESTNLHNDEGIYLQIYEIEILGNKFESPYLIYAVSGIQPAV